MRILFNRNSLSSYPISLSRSHCIVFCHLSCTSRKNFCTLFFIFPKIDFAPKLFLYICINSSKFISKISCLENVFTIFFLVIERYAKHCSSSGNNLNCSPEILVISSDFLALNSANIRKMCLNELISFPKDLRTNHIQTLSLSYGFARHSSFHFECKSFSVSATIAESRRSVLKSAFA